MLAAAVLLIACSVGFGGVTAVAASPVWVDPSAEQVSAAVTAAHSTEAIGYARSNFRRPGHPDPGAITVGTTGTPVFTLDPAFVRGENTGPAAVLAYVAVVAHAQDGSAATIQVTPESPGRPDTKWRVDTVLSGDDEHQLTSQLSAGAVLLNEPQINGWYALGKDGVRLLRASMPQSPVGALVPLDAYQRQVRDRYADKQPQFQNPRDGESGLAQPRPTSPPAAQAEHGTSGLVPWIAGGSVLLLLGAAYLVRRLRARRHAPR
ncbi:hypothetical protein SAMN05444320_107210 [Streptoalloteichus hindustanus]|uniref:LPXTG-motif cell wall anchor domain-containing protein n=1 Tax=Streptoalloteichus hindustanus TaxID=2017 RepID=A0A1M5IBN2_STRHI|nr:hypothetical protein SAMN05444320_107210 [Streptoalloteichus hindustanus]